MASSRILDVLTIVDGDFLLIDAVPRFESFPSRGCHVTGRMDNKLTSCVPRGYRFALLSDFGANHELSSPPCRFSEFCYV